MKIKYEFADGTVSEVDDTVGKNAKKIQEYIQNQLKEDWEYDRMTLKEYIDLFIGESLDSGG